MQYESDGQLANRGWAKVIATALGIIFLANSLPTATSTARAGEFVNEDRAELSAQKRRLRASLFLSRATFGPTEEEINALADEIRRKGTRRACSDWIDAQIALPASGHLALAEQMMADDNYAGDENGVWIQRYRWHAFWHIALKQPDQLRQRVAWALIQILVTSEDGAGFNDRNFGNGRVGDARKPRWLGPTDYYDILVNNAFGNYRDMLTDVTYHPVMGIFLSHYRNRKASPDGQRLPDENYAREIMQLFTIGLYELNSDGSLKTDAQGNLIPTYDNEDIKEYARVFTGLTPPPNASNNWNTFYSGNDLTMPMVMYNPEHDMEPKRMLDGTMIDEDDGDADIAAAIDFLFEHDNTGPFISYRLIQRLVKSNPSSGYVRRVASVFNDNGSGVKGDLGAVIKAILLDPEAWRSVRIRQLRNPRRLSVSSRGTEYSRMREPLLRYAHILREANVDSDYPTGRVMMTPVDWVWTQEAYKAPSVFNFWLPDYQPPGEIIGYEPSRRILNGNLVAPEFQLKTSVTSNYLQQKYIWDIDGLDASFNFNGMSNRLTFRFDEEIAAINDALNGETDTSNEVLVGIVDKLDLVHCTGTMPQDYKDLMVQTINQHTEWMKNNNTWRPRLGEERFEYALLMVTTSPFCAVAE
ncbi:MAG: DUF1800 family protein [Planctomycetota bacterium]